MPFSRPIRPGPWVFITYIHPEVTHRLVAAQSPESSREVRFSCFVPLLCGCGIAGKKPPPERWCQCLRNPPGTFLPQHRSIPPFSPFSNPTSIASPSTARGWIPGPPRSPAEGHRTEPQSPQEIDNSAFATDPAHLRADSVVSASPQPPRDSFHTCATHTGNADCRDGKPGCLSALEWSSGRS